MKQLLIVNSAKALNAGATYPTDLSSLQAGAISFFELGASTFLAAAPKKNFGIALGLGTNMAPFVIPEVDVKTLNIVKTLPQAGATFAASFTFPTAVVGKEYTVVLLKKGAQFNERNRFSTSIVASVTTDSTNATAMRKAINDKTSTEFPFVATGSSTTVTITCQNAGEDWDIQFVDALAGTTTSSLTHGKKAIGDKAYIQDIAQKCAAGKGFNYLAEDGKDIYPGYPESVEDVVPNTSGDQGASTAGYALYTLRFQVGRDASKTRDEKVWQLVHIAIPITGSAYSSLNTILATGNPIDNSIPSAATTTSPGSGYLTKTVADTLYDPV